MSDSAAAGEHLDSDRRSQTCRELDTRARTAELPMIWSKTRRERLGVEREKSECAFTARRRAAKRTRLPAVRDHRLTLLAAEDRSWRETLGRKAETSPELGPLLLVRVEGGGGDG